MNTKWNYYKIKWTAFFVTVFILGLGFTVIYMTRPRADHTPPQSNGTQISDQDNKTGYYSNQAFGDLIETTLSELNFIEDIRFSGKSEGHFSLTGTFSNPKRLVAVCPELESFAIVLNALKGEAVTINGHIGENAYGNGCFIADTITFSDHTLPAGIATSYIEKYTGLNDLLEVPVHQISLTERGITFAKAIPTAIQIAVYK